jgi:hypothetical protein
MSKSRTKSALTLLFATSLTLALSVGCSKQGEGERCDRAAAGDTDCEDGLVCTNVGMNEDRCCPPDSAALGDSRCMRTTTSTGGQSSTGGAGGGGGASNGGASNAGNGGMSSSGGSSAGSSSDAGAPAQGGSEGG